MQRREEAGVLQFSNSLDHNLPFEDFQLFEFSDAESILWNVW